MERNNKNKITLNKNMDKIIQIETGFYNLDIVLDGKNGQGQSLYGLTESGDLYFFDDTNEKWRFLSSSPKE